MHYRVSWVTATNPALIVSTVVYSTSGKINIDSHFISVLTCIMTIYNIDPLCLKLAPPGTTLGKELAVTC